jgi:tartrate-resistant acid phosphatase type 5
MRSFSPLWMAIGSALVFVGCSPTGSSLNGEAPALGVPLLGDQGKGNDGQQLVANALHQFCQSQRCDFGLLLGDNFYNSGVKNVHDKKFQTHFEIPYGKMGILWWAALGNHDYGFGWSRGNVNAQVEYTLLSKYWRMPSRFYTFEASGIEFIFIDTVALEKDENQQKWLNEKLAAQTEKTRVVVGHYPIHSAGMHGDTTYLRDHWAPKFCGKVALYIAGHDHHLEHTRTDCGVELVVSGSGAESRAVTPTPRTKFAASALGFAYLTKEESGLMTVSYFDTNLTKLASFSVGAE